MYTLSNPRPQRGTIAAVKLIERGKIARISQSFRKHLKFLPLDDEECNFSRKNIEQLKIEFMNSLDEAFDAKRQAEYTICRAEQIKKNNSQRTC